MRIVATMANIHQALCDHKIIRKLMLQDEEILNRNSSLELEILRIKCQIPKFSSSY